MEGTAKKELYQYHALMCQVFSHPIRLEILDTLREKDMSVSELSHQLGVGMANLSQHLAMMRERGIMQTRKEGNVVYYRVANPKMLLAFDILREVLLERMDQEGALARGVTKALSPS